MCMYNQDNFLNFEVSGIDRFDCTVEPPIKDPPSKGHNRNNLSTKDTFQGPKCCLSYSANTFSTSKERTTSLQRTNGWSQSVLYLEVPLYSYF